jgi:hypothetical protein
MTIPKKTKGLSFSKKAKKNTDKRPSKKMAALGKSRKNIPIEFEDEFLSNSLLVHNILE